MTEKAKKLSWEPIRDGDIYCAPACGGKCTWAAYEKAVTAASKLAKQLGEDWKPRIWENLGWHYSVVNGGWKVQPHSRKGKIISYTAYLGTDEMSSGRWAEYGKTPNAAIRNTMKVALADAAELHRMLGMEVDQNPKWPIEHKPTNVKKKTAKKRGKR